MHSDGWQRLIELVVTAVAQKLPSSSVLALSDLLPCAPGDPDLVLRLLAIGGILGFALGFCFASLISRPCKRLFVGALCYAFELEPARTRTLRVYRG
jgi:hypothetical protein